MTTNPLPLDSEVWRYMSFTKFVAMLSQHALHFARYDQFEDPFEGALGSQSSGFDIYAAIERLARKTEISVTPGDTTTPEELEQATKFAAECKSKLANILKRDASSFIRQENLRTFISCWHHSSHESEALWRLYSKDTSEAVAISTTIGRLKSALPPDRLIEYGLVSYVPASNFADAVFPDPDTEAASLGHSNKRFFIKRISFEHEKEFRLVLTDHTANASGVLVPADLSKLIGKVTVSTYAPRWLPKVVSDTLRKFGIEVPVAPSTLADVPIHYWERPANSPAPLWLQSRDDHKTTHDDP